MVERIKMSCVSSQELLTKECTCCCLKLISLGAAAKKDSELVGPILPPYRQVFCSNVRGELSSSFTPEAIVQGYKQAFSTHTLVHMVIKLSYSLCLCCILANVLPHPENLIGIDWILTL
jgi:hypothetical protein